MSDRAVHGSCPKNIAKGRFSMINAALLKQRRLELGLSVRSVAEQMGYSGHWGYYRLECGAARGTLRQLALIEAVLGLTWSDLQGANPGVPNIE